MRRSKKQQRVIDALEEQCQLVRSFMNDWLLFNQILSAYPQSENKKAKLENQFLKVKSKLAREHRVLSETLQGDYQLDGNTMNIVAGATSLESIYGQSDMSVKKLQQEWHRAFISINETLGGLEEKKTQAEGGGNVAVGPAAQEKFTERMRLILKRATMVAAIIMALFVVFLFTPPGRPVLDSVNDYIRERGVQRVMEQQ